MQLFKDYMLAIVRFCAEECKRQRSGEESVAWMVNAYNYAAERFAVEQTVTEEDILEMARMIEPERNASGYRTQACHFGSYVFTPWQNIARSITSLLEAQDRLNPVEFYTELEKVHPFADGNGRLGAILFNVKNGTFYKPEAAPDVFKKDESR